MELPSYETGLGALNDITGLSNTVLQTIDRFRKPKLQISNPEGNLFRHCDLKNHKDWGIFDVGYKIITKHKPVVITGSRMMFYMKEEDLHGWEYCGEEFPPKIYFNRCNLDGSLIIPFNEPELNLHVDTDTTIYIRHQFYLGGKFAAEYGADLFANKFKTDEVFTTFYTQFQYRFNGELYWSDEVPTQIYAYNNKVWDGNGSYYINEDGKRLEIVHKTFIGQNVEIFTEVG